MELFIKHSQNNKYAMKTILLLFPIFVNLLLCAQNPKQIIFEDSDGEKDTVTIFFGSISPGEVYDSFAYRGVSVYQSNPNKPFEVFLLPYYDVVYSDAAPYSEDYHQGFQTDDFHYYTKEVVLDNKPQSIEPLFLFFKCNSYPITLNWKASSWENEPRLLGTNLLPDLTFFSSPDLPPNVYPVTHEQCLRFDGTWTVHLGADADYNNPNDKVFGFIPGTTDTLYGLSMMEFYHGNCDTPIGFEEGANSFKIQVSPNPASDVVKFKLDGFSLSGNVDFICYDFSGRNVLTKSIENSSDANFQLDISRLHSGIYYYNVKLADSRIFRGKFVKI
jgi:Secretion system C-terminal sorting domain